MQPTRISLGDVQRVRDQCLCLASQRAARALARRFDAVFRPLGLTSGQFSMLMALSGQWQPSLAQLAGFLAMDQATVTAAIRRLDRAGLVTLSGDPRDGRIRRPALTEPGHALLAKALPVWQAEHDRLPPSPGLSEALAGLIAPDKSAFPPE